MSFTPGDTAFGALGDDTLFAGVITQSGKQVSPLSVWMGRYTASGGKAQEAAVLLTNMYGDVRREPMCDGFWFSSSKMLIDERTTFKTKEIKEAIMGDLAGDPEAVVLDLNHGQTFTVEMLEDPVRLEMPGMGAYEQRYAHAPAFVSKIYKGVAVFDGTCVISYHPGLTDWEEIMSLMSETWRTELSPQPPIPFRNIFGTYPGASRTFERTMSEDGKAHRGRAEGFVCGVEYKLPDEDIVRFAEVVTLAGPFMPAFHIYQPADVTGFPASSTYWSRDLLLGHRDLILSNNFVQGGVDRTTVTRLIFITDFQGTVILHKNGYISDADVYTMGAMQVDATLQRFPEVSFRAVAAAVMSYVTNMLGGDPSGAAKALAQREMEAQVSGKASALAFKTVTFPVPALYMIALPAFGRMCDTGDGHLTWSTGAGYDVDDLLDNVESKRWMWDADRAGKSGVAASNYETSYYSMCRDSRPKPKAAQVSYSFERGVAKFSSSYLKIKSDWQLDLKSAQLPKPRPQPDSAEKRKWDHLVSDWVPKSTADPARAELECKFGKPTWAYWG